MLPRGRLYRYPPARGLDHLSMGTVGGGVMSMPYDIVGGVMMPPNRDSAVPSQPLPIGALTSALANASPDQQRTVCLSFLLLNKLLVSSIVKSLSCRQEVLSSVIL